jgi:hypothetical protein
VVVGVATFAASAGAGVLWTLGGPTAAFAASAAVAAVAALMLPFARVPGRARTTT